MQTRTSRSGASRGRSPRPAGRHTGGNSRFGGNRSGGSRSGGGNRFGRHHGQGRGQDRRSGGGSKRKQPTFDPTQFINKNPQPLQEDVYTVTHQFSDFKLDRRLNQNIANLGITTPSRIQDQIIPEILAGRDVIGLSETGTGKTAAFLIPLIERQKNDHKVATLIMTPTRELALQIELELKKLAQQFKLFSVVCVGGAAIGPQLRQLKKRNQFIIGTPGRLKDLIDRGAIRTETITTVVLDEADRMLDMGFIHDMRDILGDLPVASRHTLFFSATMNDKARELANEFMIDPVTISVKKRDVTSSIKQDVIPYQHAHKFDSLLLLLNKPELKRVIIFGAMKHSVEKLGKALTDAGVPSESIHGNKSHGQRQRSLSRFKSGQVRVLVATDVAARGIHVDGVTHVINYDLPNTFDDYVHRIGRTGRGNSRGEALTFVPEDNAASTRR